MIRRQARLRREYIYRKSIEDRERTILEKKQRLRSALDENKQIPSDLQDDAIPIQKTLDWDYEDFTGNTTHIDDEYKWAGVEDPKIMVTTSRDPSSKLKQFAKEVRLLFPNSQRINRGNYEIKQLVDACRSNDVTDLIIVQEHRGVPDGLVICHLPYGPTAYFNLSNVVMRHDIPDTGTMSEAYPHLIFNNFSSKLGNRVKSILKYLYPVPKEDSRRIMTFSNDDDFISFRHHVYKKVDGGKDIELEEVGPRFEMKVYQIILGTLDTVSSSDVEWVYRPYMNTAKKRKFLTNE
ncbi:U3 small nucleolar ribonucleoprotein protein IMP4-like [Ruditapes philippinarum]|uniref:U3 small nucleolar ribonucleoprotein protein IMP4-like n=1 Tax=Ruditapes philippinarum TaxID=129788 RepID=UPI00295B27A2|nr:U3 small nucleolar ribonucleoprotein protein IMP4-like [Ruditapes philippinarum]